MFIKYLFHWKRVEKWVSVKNGGLGKLKDIIPFKVRAEKEYKTNTIDLVE